MQERIRSLIEENSLFGQDVRLKDDDSFLDCGILDSTGILQLIALLGEEFGVSVRDEEITPDNLDSIDRVAAFVRHKRNGGGIR